MYVTIIISWFVLFQVQPLKRRLPFFSHLCGPFSYGPDFPRAFSGERARGVDMAKGHYRQQGKRSGRVLPHLAARLPLGVRQGERNDYRIRAGPQRRQRFGRGGKGQSSGACRGRGRCCQLTRRAVGRGGLRPGEKPGSAGCLTAACRLVVRVKVCNSVIADYSGGYHSRRPIHASPRSTQHSTRLVYASMRRN